MSDDESLFNFIPPNQQKENNPKRLSDAGSNTPRKRKYENELYSYIKIPVQGRKIIKIEICDVDKIKSEDLCNCNAEVCCQYVVKNVFKDEVYNKAQELIEKMSEYISGHESPSFF